MVLTQFKYTMPLEAVSCPKMNSAILYWVQKNCSLVTFLLTLTIHRWVKSAIAFLAKPMQCRPYPTCRVCLHLPGRVLIQARLHFQTFDVTYDVICMYMMSNLMSHACLCHIWCHMHVYNVTYDVITCIWCHMWCHIWRQIFCMMSYVTSENWKNP